MSRPPARNIETVRIGNYNWTVAENTCNWQVLRNGKPIYVVKQHWLQDRKTYPRCTFSNQAHAQRLANKLNERFKTNCYTAEPMTV